MFFKPSDVLETASIIPVIGFTANPVKPYPTPLKNPENPSFLAPSKGFRKTPEIPYTNP